MSSIPSSDAPVASFRSPRFIAKLTTAAFVLFAVGCAWSLSLSIEALSVSANPVNLDERWAESFDARIQQASFGSLGFYLVTAVFFAVWTHRVAKNARCFDRDELTVTPGWAVGSYFIPIASLWRPFQALTEIWRASSAEGHKRVPRWVTLWWVAWIVSLFADRVLMANTDTATLEEWASLHRKLIATDILSLVAAGLAMAVVWRLTRIQDERSSDATPARAIVEKR